MLMFYAGSSMKSLDEASHTNQVRCEFLPNCGTVNRHICICYSSTDRLLVLLYPSSKVPESTAAEMQSQS